MKDLDTLEQFEESYYKEHPEEIDTYLQVVFEEYGKDSNLAALLDSLRVIGRVKGISKIALETGFSRSGVQKVLSEDGNPTLNSLTTIMEAMGYRLRFFPERLTP
jgi:probable addiction module antidote protein